MKKLAFIAAVVGVAAVFPTSAFATGYKGIVVGHSPGSLAVATPNGAVHTVSTRAHPRIGSRVAVAATAVRVIGAARRAHIRGVVVRRVGSTTFVAGGHSLLALHSGRALSSADDHSQPSTGSVIDTTASVAGGQLIAGPTQVVGQMGSIQVQAVVVGVAPGVLTLSVNGATLPVALPAGIQLPSTLVGQTVTLTLNLTGNQPVARENDDNENDDDQGEDQDDDGGDG